MWNHIFPHYKETPHLMTCYIVVIVCTMVCKLLYISEDQDNLRVVQETRKIAGAAW